MGITSDAHINKFCFPGISILINNDLKPHYDSMNPSNPNNDWTMSLSCTVSNNKLPKLYIKRAKDEFGESIPFCIVLYRRRAVEQLENRISALSNYIIDDQKEYSGRKKISDLMFNVQGANDYLFNFFDTDRREIIKNKFKVHNDVPFQLKMLKIPEAVDKMVCSCHFCHHFLLQLLRLFFYYIFKRHIGLHFYICTYYLYTNMASNSMIACQ